MYHIKQDQRSLLSARLLQDGLAKCLTDKKYTDISVSELCEVSHVSRTTFYRLFDSIDDLLRYNLDYLSEKAADQLPVDEDTTPKEYLQFMLAFLKDNMKLYEAVIMSERTDIMTESLQRTSARHVSSRFDKEFSENEKDYLIAFLISTAISMNRVNLAHGKTETPEDLLNIFQKFTRIIDEGIV